MTGHASSELRRCIYDAIVNEQRRRAQTVTAALPIGPFNQLAPVPKWFIWIRLAKTDRSVANSVWQLLLTMLVHPPPPISPDMSIAADIKIIIERTDGWGNAIQERRAYRMLTNQTNDPLLAVGPTDIVSSVSPDRPRARRAISRCSMPCQSGGRALGRPGWAMRMSESIPRMCLT
jgi:hypothetical protein